MSQFAVLTHVLVTSRLISHRKKYYEAEKTLRNELSLDTDLVISILLWTANIAVGLLLPDKI